jgi:phenylpropionate dioxygenase-like ring-hydroxylating dioxygenase large terminal subunit
MYINFWYPVILGKDMTDTPKIVRILSLDFAVFRDGQGGARVLSNICPHRGGSLAGGKIKGDHLQCPYHGWQFDGSGQCHKIPSLGAAARIPARTRVDAYPVVEKYGIVFAFLGDLPEAERPPMLEVPEFDHEGWRPTWMNFQIPYNYERSVENGLDPAHNEFVHPTHGFSGENSEYKVNDLRWVGDPEWGVGFFTRYKSPASKDSECQDEAGVGLAGSGHRRYRAEWRLDLHQVRRRQADAPVHVGSTHRRAHDQHLLHEHALHLP